jgi:hypothetical protein
VKEHGENMQQFYAAAQRMCERALIAWWQFNGEKWDGAITRRGGQRARLEDVALKEKIHGQRAIGRGTGGA